MMDPNTYFVEPLTTEPKASAKVVASDEAFSIESFVGDDQKGKVGCQDGRRFGGPGRRLGKEPVPTDELLSQWSSGNEQNSGAETPIGGERPLFNNREEYVGLKREKPEHRIIAFLKAGGHNNVEIAEITGYTSVMVSNILRQPWTREIILDEIRKAGRDKVHEVLEAACPEAVLKLEEVMRTAPSADVQRKAANDILDRVYGKASQPISVNTAANLDALTDAELAKIIASERKN